MFSQGILPGFDNVISSRESQPGRQPSDSPESQTTPSVGRGPLHANPSQQPASGKAKKTSATSGPNSSGSSKRASRRSSSASKSHPQRLSARSLRLISLSRFGGGILLAPTSSLTAWSNLPPCTISLGGSTEYEQTWRERATPQGFGFMEHTASGRRTSGSGCTGVRSGWQTPKTPTGGGQGTRETPGGGLRKLEDQVASLTRDATTVAVIPTTAAVPAAASTTQDAAAPTSRSTPQTTVAGWATCCSRDYKNTPNDATTGINPDGSVRSRLDVLPMQVHNLVQTPGPSPSGTSAATAGKGASRPALNPAFSLWLMMGSPMARLWLAAGRRAHAAFKQAGKARRSKTRGATAR